VTLLLISLEVLVDRGSLRIGAVGVHDKGVIEGERPSVVDGVDGGSGLILGGNHGMDGGVLFDVLFVERGLDLEGLQVGEVDILGDGCSDGAMGGVDVSGDLEVVARSCVDGARDVSVGAVWRFVVMLGAGTASVLPVTAPLTSVEPLSR